MSGSRRPHLVLGALVALLVLGLLPAPPADAAAPASSPHQFTDRRNDAGGAKSDVLAVTVINGDRIQVNVRMADAIAFSRWGTRITGMAIFFSQKTLMEITRNRSVFGLGGPNVICQVRRQHQEARQRYVFSMPRACMRNPATIRVQVQTATEDESPADRSPAAGFSRPVARG